MKYEIRLSADLKCMTMIYNGELTQEDLLAAQKDRLRDPETFKNINFLIHDYTDADLTLLHRKKISTITEAAHEAVDLNPDLTLIAIISDELAFRLCRTAQAYAEDISWTSHLVHSREECDKLIKKLSRKK